MFSSWVNNKKWHVKNLSTQELKTVCNGSLLFALGCVLIVDISLALLGRQCEYQSVGLREKLLEDISV